MRAIRVAMISLGCPKNQVEAERMLERLDVAGHEIVPKLEQAEVVVINTCGFITSAKEEAISHILTAARLKAQGAIRGIVVAGCLSERYREEVRQLLPEVDAVLGGGSCEAVCEAVEAALSGCPYERYDDIEQADMGGGRILSTPFYTAYLKLGDGCDNHCTYCAIPLIRGRLRSRPIEELVGEASALAEGGVRELILVAQDTTRYGEDLYGESRLVDLLRALEDIPGLRWIRLLYAYPDRISDELLQHMAGSDKVLHYIDLPLQHAEDDILRAMNRKGDRAQIEDTLLRIRRALPDVCLRTTFICGFPGETEAHFEALCRFVRRHRFDRMGCFAYSAEEGTPAASFDRQVPEDIKQRRADSLMLQQSLISAERGAALVGRQLCVLVEEFDADYGGYAGRSYRDAPEIDGRVYFTSPIELEVGAFVPVDIQSSDDYDLFGALSEASIDAGVNVERS
ncbi:MAG: 30S ribosomal protein S12 methylthiotransferase RimO [Clostridiales bacterium]|nr:30S ribosomal protein S12 methylthiotransferase RimO [Clostridiales bacterium]